MQTLLVILAPKSTYITKHIVNDSHQSHGPRPRSTYLQPPTPPLLPAGLPSPANPPLHQDHAKPPLGASPGGTIGRAAHDLRIGVPAKPARPVSASRPIGIPPPVLQSRTACGCLFGRTILARRRARSRAVLFVLGHALVVLRLTGVRSFSACWIAVDLTQI
jgi:hypothetical protein